MIVCTTHPPMPALNLASESVTCRTSFEIIPSSAHLLASEKLLVQVVSSASNPFGKLLMPFSEVGFSMSLIYAASTVPLRTYAVAVTSAVSLISCLIPAFT